MSRKKYRDKNNVQIVHTEKNNFDNDSIAKSGNVENIQEPVIVRNDRYRVEICEYVQFEKQEKMMNKLNAEGYSYIDSTPVPGNLIILRFENRNWRAH